MIDKLNDKRRLPFGQGSRRTGSGCQPMCGGCTAVYLASEEAGLCHRADHSRQRRDGDDLAHDPEKFILDLIGDG